jgi:hypothetical protein
MNDFVDGLRLSIAAFVKTVTIRLVQIRLRDQILVLAGAYALIFVSLMPILMPLSMFGFVSIPNFLWNNMLSSSSFVGTVVRTVAFPISLHAVSPLFANELFMAVMQEVSPQLHHRLRHQPSESTPLSVWLPVHLARALPLLVAGAVVWVGSKFPLIGPLFVIAGNFSVLKSVLRGADSIMLAAALALAIFVTGTFGAAMFKLFLTSRSLGAEQCDLFLYRELEAEVPSADTPTNAAMRARYVEVLKKRRHFYERNLAFVVGFALPFAVILLFVPFGFAIYVVAMGAAAVLANHINEAANKEE